MSNKIEFTQEQIDYIIRQYQNPNVTQVSISKELGINASTLNRYARQWGIKKVLKSKWTKSKIEWLKSNYNKTYAELESHLCLDGETIRMKLKELNLVRTSKYRPFKIDPNDSTFWEAIDNPRLTAPEIVEMFKHYEISCSTVHVYRRKREIKLQINTKASESSSERFVRDILERLDLAFIQEKKIEKYSVDFYLGCKACIEVQGHYWHSKPKRKLADERKLAILESLGYTVLYIWDNEFETAESKILDYVKSLGFPIQKCIEK